MSAMFGESRGYGGYSPAAWRKRETERQERERAAEALIAKLEERPVDPSWGQPFTSEQSDRLAQRRRDQHPDEWRAFYGDPSLSDEEAGR